MMTSPRYMCACHNRKIQSDVNNKLQHTADQTFPKELWFNYLKQQHGSKEHVHHGHEEEEGKAGHQCALGEKEWLNKGYIEDAFTLWLCKIAFIFSTKCMCEIYWSINKLPLPPRNR